MMQAATPDMSEISHILDINVIIYDKFVKNNYQ